MTLWIKIMTSVEQLGYRVTAGDVATQAGLELNVAQQELLALASDSGGHLRVTESGEIIYLFSQNFKQILRNKYWQLHFKEIWKKIWNALFYLIRMSFGVTIIASVVFMMIAIAIIMLTIDFSSKKDRYYPVNEDLDIQYLLRFFSYFIYFFFIFESLHKWQQSSEINRQEKDLNFLEAIFSFLFGEGNPNNNLEKYRWREIGAVIRNNQGVIIAQQVSPYLDNITQYNEDSEDYMLPILNRFNGYPRVSSQRKIIYYFPRLQVTAKLHKKHSVPSYLKENLYCFSRARSRQIILAIGLVIFNFLLAIILVNLIKSIELLNQIPLLVSLSNSIYWILLVYSIAFLGIPLIRYLWVQWRNNIIKSRNMIRKKSAENLWQPNDNLQQKIKSACEFAAENLVTEADISYTTEKDIGEQ